MAVKIFVLGRPGSGKSTAFRHIDKLVQSKGLSAIHFNDYDILQEMFRVEKLFGINTTRKKFQATEYGGFDVIDFSVLDSALRELEKEVRHCYSQKDELIVIEFARADYGKALEQFSPAFLGDAYLLFIETDMKTCIQRVHDRATHPTTEDDHFVSEHILRSYYSRQYLPSNLKTGYSIDKAMVKTINSSGSEQDFLRKVERFIEGIFMHEARSLVSKGWLRSFNKKNHPYFDNIDVRV